jgi:hypothetical protein
LPRQTEYDQESILPQPELNPLLNPLLGQHMGRWAEVYFTAAPEHREEAVLALLRELESDTAPKPADSIRRPNFAAPDLANNSVVESLEFPPQDSARTSPKSGRIAILPKSVTCESCGQAVPDGQRFCGMCGASMRWEAVGAQTEAAVWPKAPDSIKATTPVRDGLFNHHTVNREVDNRNVNHEEMAAGEFDPVDADDLREKVFSFGGNVTEQKSAPYRFRIYVGAALAILMVVLLIMVYRATQDWSRSSHPPQAAPSASPQPAAQPPATPDTPAEARDDGRQLTQADRKIEPTAELPRSSAPPPITPDAASVTPAVSSVAANQGNGSEELLVAERYLNAPRGKARDSSEAAKWLWQAVGKQNAAATLLLSDLYLKGDGVPKNCDQARMLLDAAARKGAVGAGQRLRNLQAFGCQ